MLFGSRGILTVRTLGHFRTQDAGVVGREDGLDRRVQGIALRGVVGDVEQAGQVTV